MNIIFETNADDLLFGFHFMNYENELKEEGSMLQIGFVLFSIVIQF